MATKTLTYGTLPEHQEFEAAFVAVARPAKTFHCTFAFAFTNDPRVGTCELTCSELWMELVKAREESLGTCALKHEHSPCSIEAAGQWCSNVLGVLGFEWV